MTIAVTLRLIRPGFDLDLSIEIPADGVTGVCGPSGSGKTTLLRALAGLEPEAKGVICLRDHCWQDDRRGLFVPPHRRGAVMVFQDANLFPHLTVRRNLEYGRRRAGATTSPSVEEVADRLGIGPFLGRHPGRLSGGERQRVALARALLAAPTLLLMDEPLASLDTDAKRRLLPYLDRFLGALEAPVIYVSHDLTELRRLTTRLIRIERGRVVQDWDPEGVSQAGPGRTADAPWISLEEPRWFEWPAEVISADPHVPEVRLAARDGRVQLMPKTPLEVGTRLIVRLPLHAARILDDTRERPAESALLQARVAWTLIRGPGRRLVGFALRDQRITLPVARPIAEALDLEPGRPVSLAFPFLGGYRVVGRPTLGADA